METARGVATKEQHRKYCGDCNVPCQKPLPFAMTVVLTILTSTFGSWIQKWQVFCTIGSSLGGTEYPHHIRIQAASLWVGWHPSFLKSRLLNQLISWQCCATKTRVNWLLLNCNEIFLQFTEALIRVWHFCLENNQELLWCIKLTTDHHPYSPSHPETSAQCFSTTSWTNYTVTIHHGGPAVLISAGFFFIQLSLL